jgi:hypothetical protein
MTNHSNRAKAWSKDHKYRGINIIEDFKRGPYGHHTFDVWVKIVAGHMDSAPKTFASLKAAKSAIDAAIEARR